MDSLTITMVAYTIAMSMALIFAQRHNYEVDSNQELFAQVKIVTTLRMHLF
jgi:solute carrier family 26 protein